MKKIVVCLLTASIAVGTFTGCGSNDSNSKAANTATEEQNTPDNNAEGVSKPDTSWYTDNPGAISSGYFIVGKDIKAGNYTYTVDYMRLDDTYSHLRVFESEADYMKYYQAVKDYDSDYDTYMSYVLSNASCKIGESMAANLVDGNVVVLSDTQGKLTGDAINTSKKLILDKGKQYAQGVYQPGTFKSGTYIASNNSTDEDGRMSIVLFDGMDNYKACISEEGYSVGDWEETLAKYAYYDYTIYPGETMTFNVHDDTVVLIDFGTAFIQQVNMGWSVD